MGLRLPVHCFQFLAVSLAEGAEQHVADGAVHRPRHQLGEQRAGRTHHRARDDHGGIVEHETLDADGETGERVVEGDDHRHVGTADGQRFHYAEGERQGEEHQQGDAGGVARVDDQAAGGERHDEHHQIDLVLKREAQRPLHQALQLREGDDGTRERHRPDQRAQQGQGKKKARNESHP